MKVAETLSFDEYLHAPRFCAKRPRARSRVEVERCGDNLDPPRQCDVGGTHVLVARRFLERLPQGVHGKPKNWPKNDEFCRPRRRRSGECRHKPCQL